MSMPPGSSGLGLPAGEIGRLVWSSPSAALAQTGALGVDEFWREVARALSLDDAEASELYEDCWSVVCLDERVAEWLGGLRPRYKLASLSNGWSNDRHECEARLGLSRFFDVMVFSAEEGIAKPAREIYERTLQRLEVAPEEAVFFDDRLDNVEAAQKFGLVAAHVTTPEELLSLGPELLSGPGVAAC